MSGRAQRRLAAIVSTDIVGYSRLLGADESGTLARMKAHRRELWTPMIEKFGGRVVGTAGDALLIEFGSAVSAVESSIEVQHGMAAREAGQPEDSKMLLRVGVNIGEVVVEDDDIFGDGVNVAARLQAMASPGGICISDDVYRQVRGKVEAEFADGGEQRVKNIADPVKVWRWSLGGSEIPLEVSGSAARAPRPKKLSIAVLPFDNMSGDPDQDYFADGMVEDVITGLSRFNQLFVIARNTMFTYKGKAVDIRKVAAELGVRYVLEGSVRRAGNRVRITGQLIDAETGGHVWADRFDGEMKDVFDLQDRMTTAIVGVIEPAIRMAELERIRRTPPEHMDAYDLYLQALPLAISLRQENRAQAFAYLERALAIDPAFVPALSLSSWCLEVGVTRGWSPLTEDDRALGIERANIVLSSDAEDANAIAIAGFSLQMLSLNFDAGNSAAHRALRLNPNSAIVQTFAGLTLLFGDESETARECFEQARLLSPADTAMHILLFGIAFSHFSAGRHEMALEIARQAVVLNPQKETPYWLLASVHGLLGHLEEAHAAFTALRSLNPEAETLAYWERLPFRNLEVKRDLIEGVKRASVLK